METLSDNESFHNNNNNNNIEKDIKLEPTSGSSHKRKGSAPKRIQLDNSSYFPEEKKPTINSLQKEVTASKQAAKQTSSENKLPTLTPASNGFKRQYSNSQNLPNKASPVASSILPTGALDLSGIKSSRVSTTIGNGTTPTTGPANTQAILQIPNLLLGTDLAPLASSNVNGANLGSLLGLNQPAANTNGSINSDITTAFMQALILQSQQQQQQSHLSLSTTLGLTDITNFLRNLPVPTEDLPSYPILYTQYITIVTQLQNLIRLIEQYNSGVQMAQKSAAVAQVAQLCGSTVSTSSASALLTPSSAASGLLLTTRPLSATASSPSCTSSTGQTTHINNGGATSTSSSPTMLSFSVLKPDRFSPDTTSATGRIPTQQAAVSTTRHNGTSPLGPNNNGGATDALRVSTNLNDDMMSWRSAGAGKKTKKLIMPGKKTNFRGTSEMENTIDPNFKSIDLENGDILLSEEYETVSMPRETYDSILSKCVKSATRLIRLLMKHFFTQKELAASSLSGEGIYKLRLRPAVTEAIKTFIRRRHPFLKTGTMSLCMTDVCVQARRVANNQRSRGPNNPSHRNNLTNSPSAGTTSPSPNDLVGQPTEAHDASLSLDPSFFSSPEGNGHHLASPECSSSSRTSPALPLHPLAIPSNPNPQDMFPTES